MPFQSSEPWPFRTARRPLVMSKITKTATCVLFKLPFSAVTIDQNRARLLRWSLALRWGHAHCGQGQLRTNAWNRQIPCVCIIVPRLSYKIPPQPLLCALMFSFAAFNVLLDLAFFAEDQNFFYEMFFSPGLSWSVCQYYINSSFFACTRCSASRLKNPRSSAILEFVCRPLSLVSVFSGIYFWRSYRVVPENGFPILLRCCGLFSRARNLSSDPAPVAPWTSGAAFVFFLLRSTTSSCLSAADQSPARSVRLHSQLELFLYKFGFAAENARFQPKRRIFAKKTCRPYPVTWMLAPPAPILNSWISAPWMICAAMLFMQRDCSRSCLCDERWWFTEPGAVVCLPAIDRLDARALWWSWSWFLTVSCTGRSMLRHNTVAAFHSPRKQVAVYRGRRAAILGISRLSHLFCFELFTSPSHIDAYWSKLLWGSSLFQISTLEPLQLPVV